MLKVVTLIVTGDPGGLRNGKLRRRQPWLRLVGSNFPELLLRCYVQEENTWRTK